MPRTATRTGRRGASIRQRASRCYRRARLLPPTFSVAARREEKQERLFFLLQVTLVRSSSTRDRTRLHLSVSLSFVRAAK